MPKFLTPLKQKLYRVWINTIRTRVLSAACVSTLKDLYSECLRVKTGSYHFSASQGFSSQSPYLINATLATYKDTNCNTGQSVPPLLCCANDTTRRFQLNCLVFLKENRMSQRWAFTLTQLLTNLLLILSRAGDVHNLALNYTNIEQGTKIHLSQEEGLFQMMICVHFQDRMRKLHPQYKSCYFSISLQRKQKHHSPLGGQKTAYSSNPSFPVRESHTLSKVSKSNIL